MKKIASKIKQTVTKLAKNKKASQTDAESKAIQKVGEDMAAPNDHKTGAKS